MSISVYPDQLYVDGGVIDINPSPDGGTWAYRLIKGGSLDFKAGEVVCESSGTVLPERMPDNKVTNNQTELLAALRGLEALPDDWYGNLLSDSKNTLGRLFWSYSWNNIPEWMHLIYRAQVARLVNWERIVPVLLEGHPNKKQLAAGFGEKYPVSPHNVACDKACGKAGEAILKARYVMVEGK